jgi:hypothetical protein
LFFIFEDWVYGCGDKDQDIIEDKGEAAAANFKDRILKALEQLQKQLS